MLGNAVPVQSDNAEVKKWVGIHITFPLECVMPCGNRVIINSVAEIPTETQFCICGDLDHIAVLITPAPVVTVFFQP
jgi:hypothetical protein